MSTWHMLGAIVGRHLIPSLLASCVIGSALWLLDGLGRLRRPAHRVAFRYAAIVKAGLATCAGAGISCLESYPRTFGYYGLRLPNLVPDGTKKAPFEIHEVAALLSSPWLAGTVLILAAVLGLGLLCYRWLRLAPVYRHIYERCELEATEFAELSSVFDGLVARAPGRRTWFPRPKLLIVRDAPYAAFTMGICPPIVVLSAPAARALGERELTGILAHELAHVRRLDYLGRWLATVLRDLMIWNPLVVLWYSQLIQEQEKACDEYAAELLGDPVAVASGLVEISAYLKGLPVTSLGPLAARRRPDDLGTLEDRVGSLERRFLEPQRGFRWPRPVAFLVLVLFLVIQPHVALSLPDLIGLLWHPP